MALLSLKGKPVPTGKYRILFTPEAVAHIFMSLSPALSGKAAALHNSFLWNKKEKQVASPLITIVDDGLNTSYASSGPFDDEGVPINRKTVIDRGILMDFQYDLHSSAKYNHPPTGNSRRMSYSDSPRIHPNNLVLLPGNESQEEIVKKIDHGLFVNQGMGFAGNPSTGDFSLASSGALIENGEITSPVTEITIAGNLLDMFKSVAAIGNDIVEVSESIVVPSILIEDITVGGI